MLRSDGAMLAAILIAGALVILLFTVFFAFVLLDDEETPTDGWPAWDVDEGCDETCGCRGQYTIRTGARATR